jgi:DNA modification methylase
MILHGDCLQKLKEIPDNSVDSLVCDPPAGISFMGKSWDSDKGGRDNWIAWLRDVMLECKRVMKPGAHGFVWAIPRTSHWTATAVENAGFEIRDIVTHHFGSGFPKSHNIEKATGDSRFSGIGTALKPATEHWILCRKPISEKTVAANVIRWGCGGINIDASRVRVDENDPNHRKPSVGWQNANDPSVTNFGSGGRPIENLNTQGRFPANLVLDEESGKLLDLQSGINASRFFYTAKASKSERNAGLEGFDSCAIPLSCEENTELEASLLKVILESIPNLSIVVSGEQIMAISPKECTSTIRTEIHRITESKTWNWLMHSLTSVSIQDAPINEGPGTSLVHCVEKLRELTRQTGTLPDKDGSLIIDAAHAIYGKLLKLKEQDAWQKYTSNHPTVKPIRLMEYLIKLITPENGTVLDCFAGSGSTLVAAKRLGFKFIGIEREAEYIEIINGRLNERHKVQAVQTTMEINTIPS